MDTHAGQVVCFLCEWDADPVEWVLPPVPISEEEAVVIDVMTR